MDLNVKLQGLKYNYEKVQGCFCKSRLTGLRTSLNDGRWLPDRRLGLNQVNRYLGF
jgi:hypothetical protein